MFFKDFHFLKAHFSLRNPLKALSEQTKSNITGEISKEERKSFFNRLKAARIEVNLTQVQVSVKLGKYQSYISKVESGKKRLLIEDFIKLCELYNKHPEYFYSVFSK
ncbi:helix-turn-helix domain-containing protein [Leptospira borgpetersenii]|uniref:helix-turn-helix domain-containing protein n=1 Tax=Leptospira borgpetersenii TaxID=174 RepID=UPI00188B551A|nr:helix-turn-helix transcriptional regulator [Leptospira borgpetersenii]MBF3378013.1 helix-turn-helix transcriptional regulator [Leptospira borgpetersenii serovar Balcanica]